MPLNLTKAGFNAFSIVGAIIERPVLINQYHEKNYRSTVFYLYYADPDRHHRLIQQNNG
jgi:hypothetical protein